MFHVDFNLCLQISFRSLYFLFLNQKNGTFIPVNCGLKVTSNEDKQKRALSRNYVAINLNEKQSLKPITPNTFKQIPKNQKV